jgi:hypothetical protein
MKADLNGFYPLHNAVINNQIEVIKCLLNVYGCSPNVLDKNQNTCWFKFIFYVIHNNIKIYIADVPTF